MESTRERPGAGWIHLALVYHVIIDDNGNRLGLFATYVNGLVAQNDDTLNRSDSEHADGRIVLGRAFSEVDDFYTGMTVDDVAFFNNALGPADIPQL